MKMEKKQYEKRTGGEPGKWIRVTFVKGEDSHTQMDKLRQEYTSKGCRDIMGDLIKKFLVEEAKPNDKG